MNKICMRCSNGRFIDQNVSFAAGKRGYSAFALPTFRMLLLTAASMILGCQQPPTLDVSAIETQLGPASARTSSTFVVGQGDTLKIDVWLHDEFDTEVTVSPTGDIELPSMGSIRAEGKTIAEMRNEITQRLTPYLKKPQVTVTTAEIVSRRVYVLGEVAKPGSQVFVYDYYFWNALANAGGFSRDADKGKVLLLRKTADNLYRPAVMSLDFAGASAMGFGMTGFSVQQDDIIYVMPTGLAKAERWAEKVAAVLSPVLSLERATVLWPELIKAISGTTDTANSTVIISQ